MSVYLKNASGLLKSAIDEENLGLLAVIKGPLFDQLSTEDKDELIEEAVSHSTKLGNPVVMHFVLNTFGMTQDAAYSYVVKFLGHEPPSDELLDVAIQNLGQHYGTTLVSAVLKKDVTLARKIAHAHSYKTISIAKHSQGLLVDDSKKAVLPSHHGAHQLSREEVRDLFDLMTTCGLDALFDPESFYDSYALSEDYFKQMIPVMKPDAYPSNFPTINNGQLTHPELAIAFSLKDGAYSNLCNRIVCWVHKDSTGLPESTRLFDLQAKVSTPKKGANRYSSKDDERISIGLFDRKLESALFDEDPSNFHAKFDVGYVPLPGENEDPTDKLMDFYTIQSLLANRDQTGLLSDESFYLAVMDTLDVLAYEVNLVDDQELETAVTYAKQYMPLDLFYTSKLKSDHYMSDPPKPGKGIGMLDTNPAGVMESLQDEKVRKRLFEIIPSRSFWVSMMKSSPKLSSEVIVIMKNHFDIDNRDLDYRIESNQIEALNEAGFVFSPEGKQQVLNYDSFSDKPFFDEAVMYIRMGGWPYLSRRLGGGEQKPESIEEALQKYTRRHDNEWLKAYLTATPVGDAIKACKTQKQYEAVMDIFDASDIVPHLSEIPAKIRTNYFEESLGL